MSRRCGPFPSRHAVYQGVPLRVDELPCPRTYSGRRPGRSRGRCNRRLSTDGHGRASRSSWIVSSGSVRCRPIDRDGDRISADPRPEHWWRGVSETGVGLTDRECEHHFQRGPCGPAISSLRSRVVAGLPTRELLELAVESGYTGPPWEELARRLIARALADLEQSIHSGSIYQRCRRVRLGIPQRRELQRRPLAGDIAAEAVEDCLERFKAQVLPRGEWDPDRGVSLEDFFAACCIPHVANRWRWHLRQLPPQFGRARGARRTRPGRRSRAGRRRPSLGSRRGGRGS